MAYVQDRGLYGDTAVAIDRRDNAAALVASDAYTRRFQAAYFSAQNLSPERRQLLLRRLKQAVAQLPTDKRAQAEALIARAQRLDPRTAPGLGTAAVASTASTIASIAGIVATLGTIGLQVGSFLEQKKATKAQQAAADRQAAAETALLNQQAAAAEQRLAQDKARFEEEMAALRAQRAPASAAVPGAAAAPASEPTKNNTTPLLIGSGIAAAAATFLLK